MTADDRVAVVEAVIAGAHAVAYHTKPLSYLACSLKTVAEVLSWT